MTAEETLNIISKIWCDFDDLMKLSMLGINNTSKLKKEIKDTLEKQGYLLPKGLLPMCEVVKYLKIDVDYLEKIAKRGI
jgi:exopolyphosphatase/pppGpp-phosphohydrolase